VVIGKEITNQNFLRPIQKLNLSLRRPIRGSKNPSSNLTNRKIMAIPSKETPKLLE